MAHYEGHRYRDGSPPAEPYGYASTARPSVRYDPPKSPVMYPTVPRPSMSGEPRPSEPIPVRSSSSRPRASSSAYMTERRPARPDEPADRLAERLGVPLSEKDRLWEEHLRQAEREREAKEAQNSSSYTSSSYLKPGYPMHRTHSHPNSPTMGHQRHFSASSPRASAAEFSHQIPSENQRPVRPQEPRKETVEEETVIDKQWGKLFDHDDQPTARLGQLLRGIANHIIEVYKPERSLVITPDKLIQYYSFAKVDSDADWEAIIDGRNHSSLSVLYRDLACQHHFVQDNHTAHPTIPGLTPLGFQRWMTVQILADPDREVQRLQKTVQHLPINNADQPTERLPKDVSRKLFPKRSNQSMVRLFRDAAQKDDLDEPRIPLSDRPHRRSRVEDPQEIRETARERRRDKQYHASVASESSEMAVEDDPHEPAVRIERDRKPYVAKPGGGKNYDFEPDDKRNLDPSRAARHDGEHSPRIVRHEGYKNVPNGQRSRDPSPSSRRPSKYDVKNDSDGRHSRDSSPQRRRSRSAERGDRKSRRRLSTDGGKRYYTYGRASEGIQPLDAGFDRPRWKNEDDYIREPSKRKDEKYGGRSSALFDDRSRRPGY